MLDIYFFCKCKGCLSQYKGSEQQKLDDTERLKRIEQYIKDNEANPSGQWEEISEEWKKEAKEIRQKWNIKEERHQEGALYYTIQINFRFLNSSFRFW